MSLQGGIYNPGVAIWSDLIAAVSLSTSTGKIKLGGDSGSGDRGGLHGAGRRSLHRGRETEVFRRDTHG